MRRTDNITGKEPTVLQLVSASAVNPSTFVLREVRELRRTGLDVIIGQLRPVSKQMSTTGFEELASVIIRPRWWSHSFLLALAYYSATQPRRLGQYLALIMRGDLQTKNVLKMLYVLVTAITLAYECRNTPVKHVRAHFLHTEALAAYFVSHLLQAPYSITVHTVVVHFPPKVVSEVIQNASFVVADTLQVKEFLVSLSVPPEQIRLIRNGLPLDELKFQPDRPAGPPIVLAAGYLVPKKGFDVLLAACSLLLKRHVVFRCVIVGDGVERKKLDATIEALGLQSKVDMVGDLPFQALKEWYYRAVVFVMPSVTLTNGGTDGLPTVILESLACGTPVVGTKVAAIPEVILHGTTGLLVPPNAPELLADQIQSLLGQAAVRSSLAREGRLLIEKDFDVRQNSEILAKLILSRSGVSHASPLSELNPEPL